MTSETPGKSFSAKASALAVAAGIFSSKIFGLVRESVMAHFFGTSIAADAFRAAFKIPNILQNLFGEGVLSASFIPVYARLNAENRHEEAAQVAEATFTLLFFVTAFLVALGVFAAPWLIYVIAPGYDGERLRLTTQLVRILFPGAALLVFSAWCLGILNSHRKFFLSYAAPVIWNVAIIVAFFLKGSHQNESRLAVTVAWASVVGSGLQFLVQLPTVLRLLWPLRAQLRRGAEHVRVVVRNFVPVFVSRGVVQVSAYVDQILASLLPIGAVAALGYAQTLNALPVSLFGMAVSAAELPAMSAALGTADEVAAVLRRRLAAGLEQIAFFVIPSAVAFLLLGDVLVATIYRSGRFQVADVLFVWGVLAGSAVGLLASTSGRLYSSAFYALRDTRTPLNFAIIRVTLTLGLGYLFALPLPRLLHLDRHWGVAGLTLSAGIAGWVEFMLLRRALQARIGDVPHEAPRLLRLWAVALLAGLLAFALKRVLPFHNPRLVGACILPVYGAIYLGITYWMGIARLGPLARMMKRGRDVGNMGEGPGTK